VTFALWTAVVLAATVSTTPQPSSSPLKTIIDVKARTLCATLAEHVRPAMLGLMKNDNAIGYSVSVLNKTASDAASHGRIDIDMLQVKNIALALNHNIFTIDNMLNDPAHFPSHPKTPDEIAESQIKQDLLKLLDRQKLIVNALYGTADTLALSSMQHDFPEHNEVAMPTIAPALPADAALTRISNAGLQDSHVVDLVKAADSTLLGRTLYGQLAGLILIHQAESKPYEAQTAEDVREPAAQCASAPNR